MPPSKSKRPTAIVTPDGADGATDCHGLSTFHAFFTFGNLTNTINKYMMKQQFFRTAVTAILLWSLFTIPVHADEPFRKQRPKVGLVLGGGGAKGAAEVGVLQLIEEIGIPVDYVAGTSIGAIVGAFYANGFKADSIETLFKSQNWSRVFTDSFLRNKSIEVFLDEVGQMPDSISFDKLPIPYRCVAVDLKKVEEIVLDSGSLAHAVHASMAIPGVFKSVEWDGRQLVDGGVLNNLPVDVVKAMGADIVIAVDLSQKKVKERPRKNYDEHKGWLRYLQWFFCRPDQTKYLDNVKMADVRINPKIKKHSVACFSTDCIEDLIEIGKKAARKHRSELRKIKKRIYDL